MLELFLNESLGPQHKIPNEKTNGFLIGKKWMDVNITMWREDIEQGFLLKRELYDDPLFLKHYDWLDRVLKGL